jgi:hypothetical protein
MQICQCKLSKCDQPTECQASHIYFLASTFELDTDKNAAFSQNALIFMIENCRFTSTVVNPTTAIIRVPYKADARLNITKSCFLGIPRTVIETQGFLGIDDQTCFVGNQAQSLQVTQQDALTIASGANPFSCSQCSIAQHPEGQKDEVICQRYAFQTPFPPYPTITGYGDVSEEPRPERTALQTPQATSPQTPQETSAQTPQETSEQTPQETSEQTPQETSEQTPQETSEQTPQETSEQTPQETSAQTPQETSAQTQQETSAQSPADTRAESPRRTPVATPDPTIDQTIPPATSHVFAVPPPGPGGANQNQGAGFFDASNAATLGGIAAGIIAAVALVVFALFRRKKAAVDVDDNLDTDITDEPGMTTTCMDEDEGKYVSEYGLSGGGEVDEEDTKIISDDGGDAAFQSDGDDVNE